MSLIISPSNIMLYYILQKHEYDLPRCSQLLQRFNCRSSTGYHSRGLGVFAVLHLSASISETSATGFTSAVGRELWKKLTVKTVLETRSGMRPLTKQLPKNIVRRILLGFITNARVPCKCKCNLYKV